MSLARRPGTARDDELAWEDTMVNATDYRAMAAEHHQYAGMCRSPESRERHLGLEQELLALADLEETDGAKPVAAVAAGAPSPR